MTVVVRFAVDALCSNHFVVFGVVPGIAGAHGAAAVFSIYPRGSMPTLTAHLCQHGKERISVCPPAICWAISAGGARWICEPLVVV